MGSSDQGRDMLSCSHMVAHGLEECMIALHSPFTGITWAGMVEFGACSTVLEYV